MPSKGSRGRAHRLSQNSAEYDTAREQARQQQRELAHLQHEVETLKHNLALTRTPEQVTMIFEQIDQRMHRIAALTDERHSPVGRRLSAAQVATVKAFLADFRTGWAQQPPALKNEFLRLILASVHVHAGRDHVKATVVWRSGAQQQLWIERPPRRRGGKVRWTEADNAWLRAHYATATREERQAHFPHRTQLAIRKQAKRLGLTRSKRGTSKPHRAPWTAADHEWLRAYVAGQIVRLSSVPSCRGARGMRSKASKGSWVSCKRTSPFITMSSRRSGTLFLKEVVPRLQSKDSLIFRDIRHLITHTGQMRTLRNLYRRTKGEKGLFFPENPTFRE
jgi:hypothetical protein